MRPFKGRRRNASIFSPSNERARGTPAVGREVEGVKRERTEKHRWLSTSSWTISSRVGIADPSIRLGLGRLRVADATEPWRCRKRKTPTSAHPAFGFESTSDLPADESWATLLLERIATCAAEEVLNVGPADIAVLLVDRPSLGCQDSERCLNLCTSWLLLRDAARSGSFGRGAATAAIGFLP